MDKFSKVKLMKSLKGMKDASVQSGELLKYIEKEVPLSEEMRTNFYNVIKHNRNIIEFFGILEQQLQK